MKYNTVLPYFPAEDISGMLSKFKKILSGRGLLTMGEYVESFEEKFARCIGTKYAVGTNSCTSALEIALKAIKIKETDEVIVPAQTFIATGSSIVTSGGKAVFCEIDDNFLLDFKDLKRKIGSNTKAVIIVHFGGLIHPEIFQIRKYLWNRSIYLIEDAAHATGAKIGNTYAGNIGDFGCFSFYSTKVITTGEGGMITTGNKKLFHLCSSLRNRGLDIGIAGREQFSNIGSNRRLTEFQAILGLYQLIFVSVFQFHSHPIFQVLPNLNLI